MSTRTRTVNAITSLSEFGDGMPKPVRSRFGPTDSRMPMALPPSSAPTTLPIPPRTALVKA
jgi:hypothetical protein